MPLKELEKIIAHYRNLFFDGEHLKGRRNLIRFINRRLARRNVLLNGEGDTLTVEDLLNNFGDKVDILYELNLGIGTEYEHTDQYNISMDITMDHLSEFPDYNSRLKKMEEEAKKYWGF